MDLLLHRLSQLSGDSARISLAVIVDVGTYDIVIIHFITEGLISVKL